MTNRQDFTEFEEQREWLCPLTHKINDPECPLTEDPTGNYSPDYKACICPKCEVYTGYVMDENEDFVEER